MKSTYRGFLPNVTFGSGKSSHYTVDESPNLGYDSEKVKNFGPQTRFEPTLLEEMSFQAKSSTTEL